MRKLMSIIAAVALIVGLGAGAAKAAEGELLVFAAASTTNAVSKACQAFENENKITVRHSFASSSTLAKQIAIGAPADVYISANLAWMDFLAEKKLLAPGSPVNLLRNTLVLIAPADSAQGKVELGKDTDLAALLGAGRLAVGDPGHVPAGMYAKEALTSLGLWGSLADKLAPSANVRVALAMVERGETPLGIVYGTDAAISDKVKVVGVFPAETHKPIIYQAAVLVDHDTPAARSLLQFLQGPQSIEIFRSFGFEAP